MFCILSISAVNMNTFIYTGSTVRLITGKLFNPFTHYSLFFHTFFSNCILKNQKWERGEHTIRFANFLLTYTKILLRNLSYDVDKQ